MPSVSLRTRWAAALVLAIYLVGPGWAWALPRSEPGAGAEPQIASATARELWRKGSDQILAGDFVAAASTLEQVQKIEPGHDEVASTLTWMREAQALADSRERLRAQTYEYHVAQAKKHAKEAREGIADPADDEKKASAQTEGGAEDDEISPDKEESDKNSRPADKWSRALFAAYQAMLNAKDEDAFREEPWLTELVQNSLVEIDRHRQAKEWRDAGAIYDILSKIYPKNRDFKDGLEFAAKRAHLDWVYGPKTNWRSDLRDVTPSSIVQILDRVEEDYVEDVDLRELTISGLEHLILLAEAESLSKTFPTLADPDRVRDFTTRLKGLIKKKVQTAGRKERFSASDVKSVFNKALEANNGSLRLPEAVLVDEFVAGMLEPLDEFTSVIWPSEVDDFNKHTRGDFVGVGIQITQDIGKPVRVESPLEDSPAYRAGIKPGDLITAVDGKPTVDMTVNQAVKDITGKPGSNVTLTIQDPVTEESRDVVLTREHIKIRTVRGFERDEKKPTGWNFLIDPDNRIGYVRVSGFMDKTVEDLESALEQMRRDGARGIILDLRFNPGGLLTSAVRMCELFMKKDDSIVSTKGRSRQQNMEISSRNDGPFSDLPLVILVNEYSASASEIVAGSLAGTKEACVVGARTFGKGSVQNLIPILDSQAYLKLTTAKYHVPDLDRPDNPWYCLHREKNAETWGVDPHIQVKVIPQELTKIVRLRREKDLLKGKDQSEIPRAVLERRPTSEPAEDLPKDEAPNTDPQLVTALNLMRVKLLSSQPWALAPRARAVLSRADDDKSKAAVQR
jgi:carboxyl-terminal processing protease